MWRKVRRSVEKYGEIKTSLGMTGGVKWSAKLNLMKKED
jgi:hypothetical protein